MKLTFQFALLVICLFIGVLLGINTAENGIYRIEGASSSAKAQALQVTPSNSGQVEVAVLGKKYTAQADLPDMEQIKESSSKVVQGTGSKLSDWGTQIGDWLSKTTRTGLEKFYSWIEDRV
jgi:hypothetical protein